MEGVGWVWPNVYDKKSHERKCYSLLFGRQYN